MKKICFSCIIIGILLISIIPIENEQATSASQQLQPTQRFWNLKQLGSTEKGSFWLPVSCDRPSISSAAFGDIANEKYAIHLVNNGTTRQVTLNGLPDNVTKLRMYVTNGQKSMEECNLIPVVNGVAEFTLESAGYTSLFSE